MERVVAIFGVSGATGCNVLAAVTNRGWSARVLARNTVVWIEDSPNVAVHYGTLDDTRAVQAVVALSDAVCCVFGTRPPYMDVFCAHGKQLIVDAMRCEGVRRLIC
jgi:putative NADH-flavin reductase